MTGIAETADHPSAWVKRFAPLIRASGLVLDLAAGNGRHSRLLLESGFIVRPVEILESYDTLNASDIEQGEVAIHQTGDGRGGND
jgi:hypothetical protein